MAPRVFAAGIAVIRTFDSFGAHALVADGERPEAAFERLWALLPIRPELSGEVLAMPECGAFLKGGHAVGAPTRRRVARVLRIRREALLLRALAEAGVPTAELLLYAEETRWGLPRRALLATRIVDGAVDLRGVFAPGFDADLRLRTLGALGRTVRRLHDAGFFHRALCCRNVLARTGGPEPEIFLIDCPRVGRRGRATIWRSLSDRYLVRSDVYRFLRDAKAFGATKAELAAFARAAAPEFAEELLGLEPYWGIGGERRVGMALWMAFGLRPGVWAGRREPAAPSASP